MTTQLIVRQATTDFADLPTRDRIRTAIQASLERSFHSHPMRGAIPRGEVIRRFHLCMEGYKVMRNDLHWSLTRCVDHFDRLLVAALNGTEISFANRSSWFGAA